MCYSTKIKASFLTGLIGLSIFGLAGCETAKTPAKAIVKTEHSLTSPDNNLRLNLSWASANAPHFNLVYKNKPIVLDSKFDLRPGEQTKSQANNKHELILLSENTVNESYILPWGQFNQAQNHYNSAQFNLINKNTRQIISTVEFRIFDDAVAFRHLFNESKLAPNQTLTEQADVNLATDATIWSYRGERNPNKINSLSKSDSQKLSLPTLIQANNYPAIAIQEAGRTQTAPLKLIKQSNSQTLSIKSQTLAAQDLPDATSWRVLQVADNAGDLVTAQTLTNLSPANQIADTSWIKTGKSFWDWRVRGAQYGEHTYALDNESLRRMIDFAAEHGMQYVMIDANWYGPEHEAASNPFTEIQGLNIKGLIKQADQKGIGFILYLNDMASINHDLDKLFETWSSWGAAGVKYGFMKLNGKEKVEKTVKIVELAAKHKLLINFHDQPIVPSGLRRTWPNWVTREAVHGQTDGKRSYSPSGFIQMAHVNSLTGPIDMSNGFFQLDGLVESRKYVRSEVYSTIASEVARTLVIFSGLVILPDSPEAYLAKQDLFEFLQQMPTSWDESKVVSSEIEHHIVTARKHKDEWFVGAVINEQGGQLPLHLDFLDDNQVYQAKIYADADTAHYKTNREAYQIKTIKVQKGDTINMQLAPGGGQAIWFKPIN